MQLLKSTNLEVVIIIFDIEVFFKRPVNELCEEDFVAAVLVDLVELRIDVRDGANPLEMQKITLLPDKVQNVLTFANDLAHFFCIL